jgi:hypothetical protein
MTFIATILGINSTFALADLVFVGRKEERVCGGFYCDGERDSRGRGETVSEIAMAPTSPGGLVTRWR